MKLTKTRLPRIELLFITLPFLLLALTGCGDNGRPHFPVRGTVKFKLDDSNARFGMIELRSESEPIVTARSSIRKDGTFALKTGDRDGAVAGWHTVVIMQSVQNLHGKVQHNHGHEAHRKYLDHRTTDLRIKVSEDSDSSNLELLIDELQP